jgi:DNA-binding response OmpR family regulator
MAEAVLGQVLLADDEETFLLATADLLRAAGYAVDTAPDAATAAALLAGRSYDVLIADIKMPGNPDLELVRQLADTSRPTPPVILVTGYPSVRSAVESVRLAVTAYLVKPIEFSELLEEVRLAVGRSRLFDSIGRLRSELASRQDDLAGLELAGLTRASSRGAVAETEAFMTVAMHTASATLTDIAALLRSWVSPVPAEAAAAAAAGAAAGAAAAGPAPPPEGDLGSRLEVTTRALRDAVQTLERTKTAFKSRDLAQLRRALEQVLRIVDG